MTDLVNVAVPRAYLTQVYKFIGDLEFNAVAPAVPTETDNVIVGAILKEWSPERIQRMVEESQDTMRALLKALAEAPGQWLDSNQLAQAVGGATDWNSVAGALGAFGHRCYGRYQVQTLPFESRYDRSLRGKVHCMPERIANEVLKALNGTD